jgi:hypothetical protein
VHFAGPFDVFGHYRVLREDNQGFGEQLRTDSLDAIPSVRL